MDDVVLFPLPGDGAIRGTLVGGLFVSRDRRLVRWYDERMDSIRSWSDATRMARHICDGPSCCADPVATQTAVAVECLHTAVLVARETIAAVALADGHAPDDLRWEWRAHDGRWDLVHVDARWLGGVIVETRDDCITIVQALTPPAR